jgi:hypothetical protein
MNALKGAAAAAALTAALPLAAAAGQYSDLWWNPQESGWGMNVVQQEETAFVTLFVYARDGSPTWYVAPAARITHYGSAGPLFNGTLYRTRGPWHGGEFDPGQVAVVAVGNVDLEVLAKDRIRVHYSAEGVAVVKDVVRQTWDQPLVGANYVSQFILRQAHPSGGAPIGTRDFPGDVLVHFDAGQGYMRVDDPLRRCEYRGPYQTTGKLIRFSGTYACSAGDGASGTFEVNDLEVSTHGLTGYLRTWSAELNQYGRFAAVLR